MFCVPLTLFFLIIFNVLITSPFYENSEHFYVASNIFCYLLNKKSWRIRYEEREDHCTEGNQCGAHRNDFPVELRPQSVSQKTSTASV